MGLLLAACGSSTGPSSESPKTVVFSPPSLSIAQMKSMASALKTEARPDGWKAVNQDPNADAQEQARQLSALVSSGSVGALFIVAISPSSFRQVVRDAQAKGIPVVTTA